MSFQTTVIFVVRTIVSIAFLSIAGGAFGQQRVEMENGTHITDTLSDGRQFGIIVPAELQNKMSRNKKSFLETGYVEEFGEEPPASYALARIEERRAMAVLKGRPDDPSVQGFFDLRLGAASESSPVGMKPTLLGEKYFNVQSERYVMYGQPAVMQLYTDTEFGTLWIQEEPAGEILVGGFPDNIKVGDIPAKMMHVKYDKNRWGTVVGVIVDDRYIEAESSKKLNTKEQSKFIELVSSLVINYADTRK